MPGYVVYQEFDRNRLRVSRADFLGQGPARRLCCVLAKVPGTVDAEDRRDPLKVVPWLVPVIGSGCLESPALARVDPVSLADAVVDKVRDLQPPPPPGSESWETIARRFTESLVAHRQRSAPTPPAGTSTQTPDVTPLAARIVLIAALLTRFCHVGRALGPSALDRLVDETVVLRADLSAVEDPFALDSTVVDPLRDHIDAARASIRALGDAVPVQRAIGELLDEIQQQLRARTATMNSLRLMTEAAWYELVEDRNSYYGWSELMLALILRGGEGPTRFRSRRPRFESLVGLDQDVAGQVSKLYSKPTEVRWTEMWERARTRPPGAWGPDSIHEALARVLKEQADVRRRRPDNLPLPLAFSTSFDLELEMSLWMLGQPFRVVLPVHVLTHKENVAEPVWVVGTVTPDAGLDEQAAYRALRSPVGWAVLTDYTQVADGLPVIVRLTGSPLMDLDALRSGREDRLRVDKTLDEAGLKGLNEMADVYHAVTVDEYLAMRQGDAEMYHVLLSQKGSSSQVFGPNLAVLWRRHSVRNESYWSLFGVPVGDPAVRQRLRSLMAMRLVAGQNESTVDPKKKVSAFKKPGTAAATSPSNGGAPTAPESDDKDVVDKDVVDMAVKGMAVNYRLEQEEASLLSWLGFTVVHADCAEFIGDLCDYADHLSGQDTQLLQSGFCALARSSR